MSDSNDSNCNHLVEHHTNQALRARQMSRDQAAQNNTEMALFFSLLASVNDLQAQVIEGLNTPAGSESGPYKDAAVSLSAFLELYEIALKRATVDSNGTALRYVGMTTLRVITEFEPRYREKIEEPEFLDSFRRAREKLGFAS